VRVATVITPQGRRACSIDAREGLAFPACELAVAEAVAAAREHGVAFAGVCNSHHCGVVVDHLRAAAAAGMVGLGFANSPRPCPAAGGRHPIFGTNPVAAVFPRRGADALMIDLSLSEVARGKVMVAAKNGKPIPLGWALDASGEPTTDAKAALAGSMLPMGAVSSPKGAMLALVIELLVTALIGSAVRLRGVELLCRRRQPAGHRPGLRHRRSGRAGGRRALPRPRRGAGGRDAARRGRAPARRAARGAAPPRRDRRHRGAGRDGGQLGLNPAAQVPFLIVGSRCIRRPLVLSCTVTV
jgi:hypothetical protein